MKSTFDKRGKSNELPITAKDGTGEHRYNLSISGYAYSIADIHDHDNCTSCKNKQIDKEV